MSREERWSAFAELVKIDHLELELNHPLHMGLNDLLPQPHINDQPDEDDEREQEGEPDGIEDV